MNKKVKVNASILIIGNEILSGRTQDTNTSTLAIWLNSIGVNVAEVRVIPDVEDIIVDTLNLLRSTYDYVFTTGGIGPCLLYTSPSPRDGLLSRMPSSA